MHRPEDVIEADDAAPQPGIEAFAIERESIVPHVVESIGQSLLRQHIDKGCLRSWPGADIGAQPGIAVGGIAIIIGRNQPPRPEIEHHAPGRDDQPAARAEYRPQIGDGMYLHGFEDIDLASARGAAGAHGIAARIPDFADQVQRTAADFGADDGSKAEQILVRLEPRADLVIDAFDARTNIGRKVQPAGVADCRLQGCRCRNRRNGGDNRNGGDKQQAGAGSQHRQRSCPVGHPGTSRPLPPLAASIAAPAGGRLAASIERTLHDQ